MLFDQHRLQHLQDDWVSGAGVKREGRHSKNEMQMSSQSAASSAPSSASHLQNKTIQTDVFGRDASQQYNNHIHIPLQTTALSTASLAPGPVPRPEPSSALPSILSHGNVAFAAPAFTPQTQLAVDRSLSVSQVDGYFGASGTSLPHISAFQPLQPPSAGPTMAYNPSSQPSAVAGVGNPNNAYKTSSSPEPADPSSAQAREARPHRRGYQACQRCRERKVKCDLGSMLHKIHPLYLLPSLMVCLLQVLMLLPILRVSDACASGSIASLHPQERSRKGMMAPQERFRENLLLTTPMPLS